MAEKIEKGVTIHDGFVYDSEGEFKFTCDYDDLVWYSGNQGNGHTADSSDANTTVDTILGDVSTDRDSPNSRSSTRILENSETDEADTSATELLDEPQYVPASSSSSSVSEPHMCNSSQETCH